MVSPKQGAAVLASVYGILCLAVITTEAQENIQLQIPPSLIECYNTSFFMNRDNRLPYNMETLITLIEKAENSPNNVYDMRQMAVALLQRFRQDGIEQAPGVTSYPGVLPYAPTGFQFPKFRILLSRLIPGNAYSFPNSSLSREERCSLHFMLSSSFQLRPRGDENQVCNSLSYYRSQRLRRSLQQKPNNFLGDVEILENINQLRTNGRRAPKIRMPSGNTRQDWEYSWSEFSTQTDNTVSQCPVENGVIRTSWGTVAAGTVIAGIAAGLQQQYVQLSSLLALSRRPGSPNSHQTATVNIDNRWAATLAGDLAEVALVQVPVSTNDNASVGVTGGWNNTVMPKWYFLTQRQNLEMTDAEIRGGLDGLILAMNVANWYSQVPTMKLSQLLRMYYSMNGVLNSGIMACQRKINFSTMAPINTMISQSAAFAQVLDREMQLRVTLSPTAITTFAAAASSALTSYIPQYMNDISCSISSAQASNSIANMTTAMTDIYVYLDTSWQYSSVVSYVNYVLERLNINPYASGVTLLSASNGVVMVNYTNYITDVFRQWNVTTQSWYTPGFSLPSILRSIQNQTQAYMNIQQTNSSVGGRSLVALIIPSQSSSVSSSDASYATTQLQFLSEQVPDLKFIYYGGGSINRFSSFVYNASDDLYSLSPGSSYSASAEPVVARIKRIPRRIINPSCGASWSSSTSGTNQMTQYDTPGVINFYRIVPNYFFGSGSGRSVSIQSQNYMQFTVCTSRSNPYPLMNATSGSTSNTPMCTQITGSAYTYDLSNACNGYYTIHQCPPLYLSVQAATGQTTAVYCTNNACQTPSQAQYVVSVNNLGCYSGAAQLVASLSIITLALLFCALNLP